MKINTIVKNNNKTFDKKEIMVHSDTHNKDYKVIVDKKFRKSKLTTMFTDMGERADECMKNNIVFSFPLCQWCMLIKQFTDLEFDTGSNVLETYLKEIKGMEALVDAEVLDKIIASFDQSELKKVEEVAMTLGKFTKKMHDIELDTLVDGIVGDMDVEV